MKSQDTSPMASKRQIMLRGVEGVFWWRVWNPVAKLGLKFDYMADAVDSDGWDKIFDGRPIEMLWTQNHTDLALEAIKAAKAAYGTRVVTDIDDWYAAVPDYNPAAFQLRGLGVQAQVMRMHNEADSICCSTPFLVDKMGPKAHYAPNFVIPETWDHPHRPTKDKDECLIVMAGGTGRAEEFTRLKPAVLRAMEMDHVKVLCMGSFHEWLADFPPGRVMWGRFSEAHLYPRLMQWAAPDIVLSPLEHNDFNRAKSNIKWLESSMVGACFVGERWGELERTVEDGVTGHLCDGIDEWTEKLVALAKDPEVRKRTSQAAKDEVLSRWTWDAVGTDWRAALGV